MSDLPRRRRRRSRLVGCAMVTAAACLAAPGTALADASTLSTDAGAAPLASASRLSPGSVVERCLVVSTATQYTSADLGMFVTATGNLADHLTVTVETGTGGSFSDCTGFTGRLIYVGTLSGLAGSFDISRPERVGHYNPSVSSVTLRLRFAVQDTNAAQGQTTSASFWWLPVAPLPVPVPTTTTTDPGTSAPTTTASPVLPPPTTTTPPPTPTATASPLAPPVGVPLTGSGGTPAAVPPGSDGEEDPPTGIVGQLASGLVTGVTNAAQTISTAAAPALKGAAVTSLMTLPLVVLFLLVQRVFDRRDPKLALAPSYGDQFLGFLDRHPAPRPDRPDPPDHPERGDAR